MLQHLFVSHCKIQSCFSFLLWENFLCTVFFFLHCVVTGHGLRLHVRRSKWCNCVGHSMPRPKVEVCWDLKGKVAGYFYHAKRTWMPCVIKNKMSFFCSNSCTSCQWPVEHIWCFEAISFCQNCSLLIFPIATPPSFLDCIQSRLYLAQTTPLQSSNVFLSSCWSQQFFEMGNDSFYLRKSDHNYFLFFSSETVSVHCHF